MGRGQKIPFHHQLLVSSNLTDNSAWQIQNDGSLVKGGSGESSENDELSNTKSTHSLFYQAVISTGLEWPRGEKVFLVVVDMVILFSIPSQDLLSLIYKFMYQYFIIHDG